MCGTADDVRRARLAIKAWLEDIFVDKPEGSAQLFANYALVLGALGEREESRRAYQIAVDTYPGARVLRKARKRLVRYW